MSDPNAVDPMEHAIGIDAPVRLASGCPCPICYERLWHVGIRPRREPTPVEESYKEKLTRLERAARDCGYALQFDRQTGAPSLVKLPPKKPWKYSGTHPLDKAAEEPR